MKMKTSINIKSQEELAILREAGKILSVIVNELRSSLKIGMTTRAVDELAEKLIEGHHVKPAFKGYRGFPGCVCISLNQEVVHGIPSERFLKKGDIVSLDVGIIHRNFYADMAISAGIGEISQEARRLIEITRESLMKGIEQARENNRLSDISNAIQKFVETSNFSVVRDFVGHGIGRMLHEEPEIPNFGDPHQGPILKEGMVFAIEPMVNAGSWQIKILEDGWTVVTQDGKPSAHFEHTIAITKYGPEILTK